MFTKFLHHIFEEAGEREALVWRGKPFSYSWLRQQYGYWQRYLDYHGVRPGMVVLLQGDFSPNSISIFLALVELGCIIILTVRNKTYETTEFAEIGMVEVFITIDDADGLQIHHRSFSSDHELYRILRERKHPGLVLFSSGSTGKSKGAVHDLTKLLAKYSVRRHDLRTIAFLLFDHIGGLDTLFYCISNGSCLIIPEARTPESICVAMERHRAEVLPASPSFLNLLLVSEAYRKYDLGSLKYITYGAETMPRETLRRCSEVFPRVILLQKYGTTEIGTMRSKSDDPTSLWVRLGGEGYRWRVVDSILQVKAESAMLGYLNAPSPFTADGWFITGDCVEVKGDNLRILGRKSDIINVAGQKVYPAEVEDLISQMSNVADVTVYGEKNVLLGNIVSARVNLIRHETVEDFLARLRQHCKGRIEKYKIPLTVVISQDPQTNARSKKPRAILARNSADD
jgi:acyl-coenzyme A synthetase/AMP-(fatty) acid ligase